MDAIEPGRFDGLWSAQAMACRRRGRCLRRAASQYLLWCQIAGDQLTFCYRGEGRKTVHALLVHAAAGGGFPDIVVSEPKGVILCTVKVPPAMQGQAGVLLSQFLAPEAMAEEGECGCSRAVT